MKHDNTFVHTQPAIKNTSSSPGFNPFCVNRASILSTKTAVEMTSKVMASAGIYLCLSSETDLLQKADEVSMEVRRKNWKAEIEDKLGTFVN
jgi:hypothetical protein